MAHSERRTRVVLARQYASNHSSTDMPWISAAQLAEEAGCSVRRVRDLVQLGLVSKAVGQGRARRYTRTHVEQLLAVMHALDQASLTRAELLWALDRDTPSRLRRQAANIELLLGPRDRHGRVREVRVDGHLTISVAGPVAQHQKRFLTKLIATIAEDLRIRADVAEQLRARLALPRSSKGSARAGGESDRLPGDNRISRAKT